MSRAIEAAFLDPRFGQILSVPTHRIRRFVNQPRKYFDLKKLESLAASIKSIGQTIPGKIMPVVGDPDHDFELVNGERRWLACQKIGSDFLALVVPHKDEEDQFLESVVDNMLSEPHTDMEYAFAVQKIMSSKRMAGLNIGDQVKLIAKDFATSESMIERYRALLRLDPEVQELMSMERDDSNRLNGSIAHFISSLHPEVQKEVAFTVIEKQLTLNQARLLARQRAETGGQVLSGNFKDHSPRRDFNMASTFTRRMRNDLTVFLDPTVLKSLRRRGERDMVSIATELEFCITELCKLKEQLLVTKPSTQAAEVRPVAPVPEAVVLTAKPAPLQFISPAPSPVKPKKEVSTKEVVAPEISERRWGTSESINEVPIPNFDLSGKVLTFLLYSGSQPKVNLSSKRLSNFLTSLPEASALSVDFISTNAFNLARTKFRSAPMGSDAEQKFTRFLYRIRRDYGGSANFDEIVMRIMKEDPSEDPVNFS